MSPDMLTLIKFGEKSTLWSSSLCNFLHSPVSSCLLGQNIFTALSSLTLSNCLLPLGLQTKYRIHIIPSSYAMQAPMGKRAMSPSHSLLRK
jgi:hypothetical protein